MELDYTEQHYGGKKCPKVDCKKDTCKCGLERVFLSAALGDDKKGSPVAPKNGDYCNAIVVYEANNHIYLYSKDGVPTLIELEGDSFEEKLNELEEGLAQEILDRQAADATLQGEIDDIKNSPDVVDIVPTYAALQAYDTSKLGDNDIVRVLQDETHSGESTYYRWDKHNNTWVFIGSVGDYYTKGQVDTLLAGKQATLTAGSNITIESNVISATDTTYTAGDNIQISAQNVISADSQATVFYFDADSGSHGFVVGDIVTLYKDLEATQVASYLDLYNAAVDGPVVLAAYWRDTTLPEPMNYVWMTFSVLEVLDDTTGVDPESVTPSLRFTDGGNIYLWVYYTTPNTYRVTTVTPVDRTYSAFVGTDGQTAGTAGLVPAPATTDAGKFLKADGTWDVAGGGGPTVVQTTGTSTTDVMSQNATTSMVFADAGTNNKIAIGTGASVSAQSSNMAIGTSASANGTQSTAVGYSAKARGNGVSLGYNAQAGTSLSQTNATAIGQSAYGGGDHCTAVGDSTNTINSYSTAVGASARARSERSVAIGASAEVGNSPAMAYSVALGANALTTRAGEVNVGTGDPAVSTVGFNSSAYRVIGGVYDGQLDHDAVTLAQLNGRVKQNAGAPTTSTVGTVGQLLEDTTNGKLYQCTAVDTTDPNNPSYTWTEVGAGGGSITPVQTTGTSTTDVMSQDATTKMVFPNQNKRTIAIGDGTSVSSPDISQQVAIGYNAHTASTQTVAIGASAYAVGSQRGCALGYSAYCNAEYGIALGANSNASTKGQMDISTGSQTTAGYNDTNYRLLTGVHDPVNAHDAATKGYVDAIPASPYRLLTDNDINWDSSGEEGEPDAIALWLLNDGFYCMDSSLATDVWGLSSFALGEDPVDPLPAGHLYQIIIDSDNFSGNKLIKIIGSFSYSLIPDVYSEYDSYTVTVDPSTGEGDLIAPIP